MDSRFGLAALSCLAIAGCSAVVSPDTTRLGGDGGVARDGSFATDARVTIDGNGSDAWVAPDDAAVVPGDDAWVAGDDAWVAGDDAWVAGNDAWVAPNDAWVAPDAGPMCVPGAECAGYQDALAMAPRDAAGATAAIAVTNCAVQLHRTDCCGARP